jgi:hypothetical protein
MTSAALRLLSSAALMISAVGRPLGLWRRIARTRALLPRSRVSRNVGVMGLPLGLSVWQPGAAGCEAWK